MRRSWIALALLSLSLRGDEPAAAPGKGWVLVVDTGKARVAFSAQGTKLDRVPEADPAPRKEAWDRAASPDGKRIVFTRKVQGKAKYGDLELFVSDADGGHEARLTDDDRNEVCPRWLPDGKRIAYLSGKDGSGWQLWIVGADGKGARKVASADGGGGIEVSRDGKIAFMDTVQTAEGSTKWSLAVAVGDGLREIARVDPMSLGGYGFSWSPDGGRLAHGYNGSLSLTDLATGRVDSFVLEKDRLGEAHIRWRPDGKALACDFGRMGLPGERIHLVPLDGGDPKSIPPPGEAAVFTFGWGQEK